MFEPNVFEDDRGVFCEVYNESKDSTVKQVNVSISKKAVVRGLHYQEPAVTKRVWVLQGKLLCIAYNLETKEVKREILTPNSGVFECPKGWANGNQALEDTVFAYTMDGIYNPAGDKGINPALVEWVHEPILSQKDEYAPTRVL
jgi:dTDP-4-dehydrorhamnose 3,5-epimerase and related enzymes